MLAAVPLLVAALFALTMSRLPRQLIHRYRASFQARHGLGVQVGVAVLGTLALAMLVTTTLEPGHAPIELMNAALVGGLAIAVLVDLYLFDRR